MPNVFDGTNPITDILGDEPTEREVTMENQSTMTIIEPLTNTQIPAGQTVLVRVIGDIAHSTLVKNIQQINALQGLEVVGLTSVVIADEPNLGLLLVPTGADETADGEYQRFEWDGETLNSDNQGVWEANLPAEDRGAAYRIQMKMPVMVSDDPFVTVKIGDAPSYMATIDGSDGNQVVFEAVYDVDNLAAELRLYGMSVLEGEQTYTTNVIAPAPAAGTVITLDVTQTTAVMSWGNESYPLVITSGALPSPSDVFAYSVGFEPPLPLSIKVALTD